jgi:hypothetical protein
VNGIILIRKEAVMSTRTIIVPAGLTIADAKRIANALGRSNLRFIRLRATCGPRISPACHVAQRGARFLFSDRFKTDPSSSPVTA